MTVKRPVSGSLAWAFFSIIVLSVLTSSVALLTLASSQRDAEAINVAGSLRMQSYRLGYEMQRNSPSLMAHRENWRQTLSAPSLQKLNRWYVPGNVKTRYQQLQFAWLEMDKHIARGDSAWYAAHIEDFVGRIDAFVLALQHYSEHKIQTVTLLSLAGALGILLLTLFTLRRIRRQVVLPLNNLVAASERIERGEFTTPAPDTALPNELGQLSRAFNHMSGELHTLYRSLEASVAEKTRHLHEAHQQLDMLFKCSQALNTGQIDSHCFRHILQIVHEYTQMNYLELRTSDDWRLCEGTASGSIPMQNLPVLMQDTLYGELRWQSETESVPLPQMRSVATMLGRGLYFNQAQKHYQQLLLMDHSGKWHIQQYQSGIPRIREQNKQDDKNDSNTDGNHLCQTFRGTLLVLEITCPFQRISCRKMYGCIHFFLCLGNCRTHITTSHRKFHCTETSVIITEYQ